MAEFSAAVYQNEFLPDGGTDVNAIVSVTCSQAGTAGQGGSPAAGEIIIIDTSGSMGVESMGAAKQAATAALAEIEVVRDEDSGAPDLVLHGKAAALAADRGVTAWKLSLTHTDTSAHAIVIAL